MSDLLVKLYAYDFKSEANKLKNEGIAIKKAYIGDKAAILDFICDNFENKDVWCAECEYALFNNPTSCYVAVKDKQIIGFACYDATALGFFGPTGVSSSFRRKGIGKELLIQSLLSMKEKGYAYAIIGWSAPDAIHFYKNTVNAIEIPDSPPEKSIFKNSISQK